MTVDRVSKEDRGSMKGVVDKVGDMDRKVFDQDFKRESIDFLVHRTRFVILIGVPIYLAFWLLDMVVARGQVWMFLGLRLGAAAVFLFVYWLTFLKYGRRKIAFLSVSIFYLAGLIVASMTVFLGGFSSTYYVGILLVCMVAGFFLPWKFGHTLLFSIATLTSYFGLNCVFHGFTLGWEAAEPVFFLGTTCFFIVFAAKTNRKRMRREFMLRLQLESVNANLKKLDEAKTRLIANVSHELRTPLTLIVGPIESILTENLDDRLRSVLETISANARRLLRQVNMLLDMTAIECGKMRFKPKQLNLGDILKELVSAATPHASARKIRIESKGLDCLPESLFDPEKVEIMGSNLLSNAIKFVSEGGRVVVRAGYNQHSVCFSVQDSGPGIPADERKRIFDMFYQIDDSSSRKHEGSGLGLTLVLELASLHGGSIRLCSKVGLGSLFIIQLPRQIDDQIERRRQYRRREDELAAVRAVTMTAQEVESRKRAASLFADIEQVRTIDRNRYSITSWKNKGPRVLVVEDNQDLRYFIAESLGNEYHVNTAVDGQEGLEIARRFRPDLVVADIMMPRMDGLSLCRKMKENQDLAFVPIVLITAKSRPEEVVQGLGAGADDYLVKPFDIRELKARVAAQLRSRCLERKLGETESRLAAIGRMTSRIIQDLGVPLGSMLGLTQMLLLDVQEGEEPTQLAVDLHTLTKQGERLKDMLEELVDFARVDSMSLDVKTTHAKVFLMKLFEKATHDFERVGIELIAELQLDEDVDMMIDRKQIRRIFEILFTNMRDIMSYYDCGGKEHRVCLNACIESEHLHVEILGNVKGVPSELADLFFVPFAVSSEKKHGLGLGLAIARNLAIAHGGKLNFVSKVSGCCCSFLLELPCVAIGAKAIAGFDFSETKMHWSKEHDVAYNGDDFHSPKTDRHRLE